MTELAADEKPVGDFMVGSQRDIVKNLRHSTEQSAGAGAWLSHLHSRRLRIAAFYLPVVPRWNVDSGSYESELFHCAGQKNRQRSQVQGDRRQFVQQRYQRRGHAECDS